MFLHFDKLSIFTRSRILCSLVLLFSFLTGVAAPAQESEPSTIRVPPPSSQNGRVGAGASSQIGTSSVHSSGWWLGTSGIALVLAICGGICVAARKYRPQNSTALVQVVGRVSLSPRHSIFMVRAGRRLLLVGTGSQGAPTLLGELYEDDETEREADGGTVPADREGRRDALTSLQTTQGLDILLGAER